jgi:uncharacterized protein HemX
MKDPNSWATVSQWRRFFEMQEQQELAFEEALEKLVDQSHTVETMRPIDSDYSVEMRRQALRDVHRDAIRFATTVPPPEPEPPSSTEQQRITRPDLEIPVGENASRYLPQ